MKHFRWDKKYLYWGITVLAVVVCSIIFFMSLQYWPKITYGIVKIIKVLEPLTWGLVIAYLLHTPMHFLERTLFLPAASRFIKTEKKRAPVARACAIFSVLLLALVIFSLLLSMVLPQVYESISRIAKNMPRYMDLATNWMLKTLDDFPFVDDVVPWLENIGSALEGWLKTTFLPQLQTMITGLSNGIFAVVKVILNVIIGVIFSIYLLFRKELFQANVKKVLYSVLGIRNTDRILKGLQYTNQVFLDFISGKLLDTVIIGVLCYLGCLLPMIHSDYAALIAVLVGVTNIIPFFGPFIGAIPSALIVLTESVSQFLWFVGFIFILQQIDGNIIGPRIVGNKVGISSFWIMLSIIVGGGLFGVLGMICGVPIFTVLYAGVRWAVNRSLEKRGMPIAVNHYMHGTVSSIAIEAEEDVSTDQEQQ